jgi:hypothetical protein
MNIADAKRKFGIEVRIGKGISKISARELLFVGYKYCPCCKDIKKIHKFNRLRTKGKFRFDAYCVSCRNIKRKAKGRNDYKGYTASKKTLNRKRYLKNKTKILAYNEKWKSNNEEAFRAIQRKGAAKRRASKRNATPSWADETMIRVIYKKAEELSNLLNIKMEVDHVIPLQGENVCGLHVWENLQLLEKTINIKKNNKFEGE